jgi:hypothetical protein
VVGVVAVIVAGSGTDVEHDCRTINRRRLRCAPGGVRVVRGVVVIADIIPPSLNPIDIVHDVIGSAASNATETGVRWLVGGLLSAVGWTFNELYGFIDKTTRPDVTAGWFAGAGGPYRIMFGVGAAMLTLTLILSVGHAVWSGTGSGLSRTLLHDFPRTVAVMVGFLAFTTMAIELADALTGVLVGSFGGSATKFAGQVGALGEHASFGSGLIVVGLMSMVLLVGCVVLFIELVLRAGFVYILVCFVPLALAADVWAPMRGTAQRAIRLLGGVILAQPVIALCLAIGGAALGDPATPTTGATTVVAAAGTGADLASTVGVLLTGTAVVVLACFAPFVLLKLFPVGDTTATAGAKAAAIAPVTGAVSAVTSVASGGASAAGAAAAGARLKGGGG